jgi:hypothetical protein
MTAAEREAPLWIATRFMNITLVLQDITARDETARGAMFRLCGEMMRDNCLRMDDLLHPKGGAK